MLNSKPCILHYGKQNYDATLFWLLPLLKFFEYLYSILCFYHNPEPQGVLTGLVG